MTLPALDSPVRSLFERLEPLNGATPDMPAIGRLLTDFAQDTEYLAHHIDRVRDRSGAAPIHAPERGPRLLIVHRLEGQMGAIHSHKVWIAIAPIVGTETHRQYEVRSETGTKAKLEMIEERRMDPGSVVTFTPPHDVHAHGHVSGAGNPAYILVFAGDNQVTFEREEYDSRSGVCTVLGPGNGGRWVDS